ncbi:helix-turn-helix domain-containing protein [Amycolatopsis rubida]|uniref:Helix-turn-helix domain-containing protein n=1 Tax=Amycolatopsis rubida TaxID=112413 RepID=A0ABX0BZY6_9PSEU|nr:IclR family transcriptional regulator C-terminal domain-containing protein [Amycolatopsis sp. M39]MYW96153.1 helix-turn-helix domain-containing protein [Amycolatopsis rubida]NEC61144.1 helix-turn-helix domain-containing protein [Amycolatopsis rubida]
MPEDADICGSSPEHRTVTRLMRMLELVADSEPSGMRFIDLATELDLAKSSALGFLRGLTFCGYLEMRDGKYHLGPAMTLFSRAKNRFPLEYVRALQELSEAWRETAVLAAVKGDFFVHVSVVEPKEVVRVSLPLDRRNPMWPASYGKVFVAFMSSARRNSYLRRRHQAASECRRILDEAEVIRERRVAINCGESLADVYGIASPVLSASGDAALAVGLTGPAFRMRERLSEMADSVQNVARRLSEPGALSTARMR